MTVLAICAFALTWWLGCHLVARDPAKPVLLRAAAALITFALAVACGAVAPAAPHLPLAVAEQVLLCLPALAWAGTAVGLLDEDLPERRQINRGWLLTSGALLLMLPALPPPGRLVVLAPLAGALVLLWRLRGTLRPAAALGPLTVAAGLYGFGLAATLLPVDLGGPVLVHAAMAIDLLVLGFVAAVADADDEGERPGPDLRRSFVGALAVAVLIGVPATVTLRLLGAEPVVTVMQFAALAGGLTAVTLGGPAYQVLDRVAFFDRPVLRARRAALLLVADALPRRRDSAGLAALDEEELVRLTRRALRHYGDPARLLRSPLLDLPAIDRRMAGLGRAPEDALARVVELRNLLRDGVARLKPDGAGFGTTEDWRHYNCLHFRYVVGLRPYRRPVRLHRLDRDARRAVEWFRRQVSRRDVQRWEAAATRLVAARLWADVVGTPADTLQGQSRR